VLSGCDKFLDQKPDMSKAVPRTIEDCQAILDDYNIMNRGYPEQGEAAADNYFFSDENFNNLYDYNVLIQESKDNYIWNPNGEHVSQWSAGYRIVYSSNLVLDVVNNLSTNEVHFNQVKGAALYFRAFALYNLAQLFCKSYNETTANMDLGIPIRLTSDPNEISTRGTVKDVYNQIIKDFTEAISLLPIEVQLKSRPSKVAAYGALARTYLSMQDYVNAGKMADECLKLYNTLIDYNLKSEIPTNFTVSSKQSGASFLRFNAEVIFQAVTLYGTLDPNLAEVSPTLYNSYSANDRRKSVFFGEGTDWMGNPNGILGFRGNYDGAYNGTLTSSLFMGVATNEMYLIRAECYAREGNISLAMKDLNALLVKRMEPPYVNRTASSTNDALKQILTERRKELVFRTLRWTDLRRLNSDPQFAVTLHRDMNAILYTPLKPNDLRYVFLIPTKEVIDLTGMKQNPR